jgi:hypothetical protein
MKPAWLSLAACPIEKVAGHFSSGFKGERRATMHNGLILKRAVSCLSLTGLIAILIYGGVVEAKSGETNAQKGSPVKPTTAPPSAVAQAPVCDISAHPKITKVTPDPVKPGQRIVIKGTNFGTRDCFKDVTFKSVHPKEFKYVNDSTAEATVPELKPGLVPVHILTAGGTSQFTLQVLGK